MCSRKSRPHFPPGATAQRDPLGRDRAFFKEKGGKGGRCGRKSHQKKKINKILWLGQECAWVNQSQASCHIHSCAGQGGVQGAGGAGSLSGQDTSCQPAPGRQAGSLPPGLAKGGRGGRELGKHLGQKSGLRTLLSQPIHQPGPQFPHLCNDKIWRNATTG